MSTHNLCLSRKMKKSEFLSENFQFLEVKFSICLNRRVFIMDCLGTQADLGPCWAHMSESTFSHAVLCKVLLYVTHENKIYTKVKKQ